MRSSGGYGGRPSGHLVAVGNGSGGRYSVYTGEDAGRLAGEHRKRVRSAILLHVGGRRTTAAGDDVQRVAAPYKWGAGQRKLQGLSGTGEGGSKRGSKDRSL